MGPSVVAVSADPKHRFSKPVAASILRSRRDSSQRRLVASRTCSSVGSTPVRRAIARSVLGRSPCTPVKRSYAAANSRVNASPSTPKTSHIR
ncbi:hypothetical protein E1218_30745 [Kribbella turkmenica]|uniref:Uncharacterized protein n=1 Tax=Kribbella turkmenica TaxID=2530375 RepID=A0A4R4WAX1_9ACTN|nr:hypothetical protein [Kribbella turkmenica]TDD15922.1 hypothetical protein E1218_30745 [Kribbella turkmenica]